jgi:hypothetical protein
MLVDIKVRAAKIIATQKDLTMAGLKAVTDNNR